MKQPFEVCSRQFLYAELNVIRKYQKEMQFQSRYVEKNHKQKLSEILNKTKHNSRTKIIL